MSAFLVLGSFSGWDLGLASPTSKPHGGRFEGCEVRRFKGLEVQRFGGSNLKLSEFWRMLVPHLRTHMSKSFGVDGLKFEHEFMKFDPTGQFCRTCPRSCAELLHEEVILAMDRAAAWSMIVALAD